MNDLLAALADVWTDAPEWEPIYAPRGAVDKYCRDCGARTSYNRGGCGPDLPGSFTVCDECAKLDGARIRTCSPVAERRPAHVGHEQWECAHCSCGWWSFAEYWHDDGEWRAFTEDEIADMLADHATPRYVSRWGVYPYPIAEHEKLVKAQAKRRATYLTNHTDGSQLMPYCANAEATGCNGYRGDLDTWFCYRPCMLHNWESKPQPLADSSFCPPLTPGDDETCTHTPTCPTEP